MAQLFSFILDSVLCNPVSSGTEAPKPQFPSIRNSDDPCSINGHASAFLHSAKNRYEVTRSTRLLNILQHFIFSKNQK
ncbi:MAG: hypothetical protein WA740_13900 [Candidatus Binataceae bacterium]